MRKAIRLTGRRQLSQSSFNLKLADVNGKRVAALALSNFEELKALPADAEIRVKLSENKLVEVLRFGTVGKPSATADIRERSFLAPSCQVRIVSRANGSDGLLLASTSAWTYCSGGHPEGILLFQPAPTAPRLWRLDIRDEEYPILYVDERIPDASLWAKTDPVFNASILPHIVGEIMREILRSDSTPEEGWMADWLLWADGVMPGTKPPFGKSDNDRKVWIEELIDAFSYKHELSDQVLLTFGAAK
jgi:hypothetical protein